MDRRIKWRKHIGIERSPTESRSVRAVGRLWFIRNEYIQHANPLPNRSTSDYSRCQFLHLQNKQETTTDPPNIERQLGWPPSTLSHSIPDPSQSLSSLVHWWLVRPVSKPEEVDEKTQRFFIGHFHSCFPAIVRFTFSQQPSRMSFLQPSSFLQSSQQQQQQAQAPTPASDGGQGGGSYFEGSFDYRSLLPTTNTRPSNTMDMTTDDSSAETCACLPSLTWRERYLGCAVCMVAGYLLSMGSLWRLGALLTGHPLPFVFNATIGNLLALTGSCFLMGPSAQMSRMWQDQRRTATIAYLGSLVLTLIVAFWHGLFLQGLWLVLLMLIQFIAITWYCLSYIPYAQDAVMGYVSRVMQRTEY
jgi:Got1/Sft2-like family